ncbi:beta-glucosidase family protein [Henriciella pelagia]|jgi:beta-glucosidase|uniref:Beta-glucosidase n=1 Tax=Henriciella pelagia TaxID=1977912 RepID=A0ABQ1J766_9PROT|nr:glycoside hydrolase family 3 C-terminal domain-containing protein [Henriciella pelagia]GGB61701.1 beta-glucosidase [Henriciella pelagia]
MSDETGCQDSIFQSMTIGEIIARLTLEEKIAMMSGSGFYSIHAESKKWGAKPYPAGGANERLGIEGLKFSDGPRGVIVGHSTCFPCSMARGATFDRKLEWQVGEAMALEARAQGVNLLGQVCVNVLRHPGWGRAQETYGEDSFHLGEMGRALSQGSQHHNVISTVKHFALNSIENTRFNLDVHVDERTLREIYLPHFRKIIESGCLSVMSAYNKVNGTYCGQNEYLLTQILRNEWGFEGFVHSDWVLGVYSPDAAEAGLDVENPEPAWFGDNLLAEVRNGNIAEAAIDTAVRRILRTLKQVTKADDPRASYPMSLVACSEHTGLARKVAEQSAVLLWNRDSLPLDERSVRRVGVFGKLATLENTGDRGSSRVNPPYVVTPLKGLTSFLGTDRVTLAGDEADPIAAGKAADAFDAAIVIVGYTAVEEGEYIPSHINLGQEDIPENLTSILDGARKRSNGQTIGGDRTDLRLPPAQVELIRQVAAANPRVIVVIVAGSAVMVEDWIDTAPAALQTFYAGMEGGNALANLLFGKVSPSGRLPFTIARDASHYPPFDTQAHDADYGYWHGYALLDRERNEPRFPFGHGLTYSSFEYGNLRAARRKDGALNVAVTVTNTGTRPAIETPQLYIGWPGKAAPRPVKNLRGFSRVPLAPGESAETVFTVEPRDLAWYDTDRRTWRIEAGIHTVTVARSAGDPEALSMRIPFEREIDLGL